jgi:hypothetical protein
LDLVHFVTMYLSFKTLNMWYLRTYKFYLYWNEPKETPNIGTLSTVGSPKGLGPIPFLLTLGAYIVTYTTKITQTYSVKWLCRLIIF